MIDEFCNKQINESSYEAVYTQLNNSDYKIDSRINPSYIKKSNIEKIISIFSEDILDSEYGKEVQLRFITSTVNDRINVYLRDKYYRESTHYLPNWMIYKEVILQLEDDYWIVIFNNNSFRVGQLKPIFLFDSIYGIEKFKEDYDKKLVLPNIPRKPIEYDFYSQLKRLRKFGNK